jgi:hypothetical protein
VRLAQNRVEEAVDALTSRTGPTGWFATTPDFQTTFSQTAMRCIQAQEALISGAGFFTDRWLRHHQAELRAGLDLIERSLVCANPAELAALQKQYWFGALDRWTADVVAFLDSAVIVGRNVASVPHAGSVDPSGSAPWIVAPEDTPPRPPRSRSTSGRSPVAKRAGSPFTSTRSSDR